MNKLLTLALSMSLVGCASFNPPAEWAKEDTQREAAFLTVDAMDWSQTLKIAQHPELYETNPILGMHPTNAAINSYFIVGAVTHYAIAQALPPKQRKYFQVGWTIIEVWVVIQNLGYGLALF